MASPQIEDELHPGLDAASIRRDFVAKLFTQLAKFPAVSTRNDCYLALAYVIRDRLLARWVRSAKTYFESESRIVAYLSAEYLMGPQLGNNLLALGNTDEVHAAMKELGLDLEVLLDHEEEPGLGNGGLGRLAACYMDSLATLGIPTLGYGIRYEFGIFDQEIVDGAQVERADKWLRFGNPWEIPRLEIGYRVGFGGSTVHDGDGNGGFRVRWIPDRVVKGVAYDTPLLGYGTTNANLLRLWQATADDEFDFQAFDRGDYYGAVDQRVASENISKVLYPNDSSVAGKQLRLEQQYFFVSCSLQDMIRLFLQRKVSVEDFDQKFALQLNDTHPSVAVAELMRLLVDVHGVGWDAAWAITRRVCNYTNHTLLSEALETWPIELFGGLLPRHLEIIFEINRRFLDEVRAAFPGDEERVQRMSLIDETHGRRLRMANLATVGSSRINGVAALHTRLLRETVLRDFAEMWPERFVNVTNGVTPRRFVALANPRLARLVNEAIGDGWLRDLDQLERLEPLAEDASFRAAWRAIKVANKHDLAGWLKRTHGVDLDPATLFDIQVKRIHEYKRQHLALLHMLALLDRLQRHGPLGIARRTLLVGGKAAPGYAMAKTIIRFAHAVRDEILADPVARGVLAVVFLPDYSVKLGQRTYPAADLSEQISTAGKEASGTGNMKFALNGALTIGTLDGANVEIREAVGADNFFLFGLNADEVIACKRDGYRPRDVLTADPELQRVIQRASALAPDERFAPLVASLLEHDEYMLFADFRSYSDAQKRVEERWKDEEAWTRASILNAARSGRFSSDRSIRDYCREVWRVCPVPVERE